MPFKNSNIRDFSTENNYIKIQGNTDEASLDGPLFSNVLHE